MPGAVQSSLARPLTAALGCALVWLAISYYPRVAHAGHIVVANQTEHAVAFAIDRPSGARTSHELKPNEVQPLTASQPVSIAFRDGDAARYFKLQPGGAYRFVVQDDRLSLENVPLADPAALVWINPPGDELLTGAGAAEDDTAVGVVHLKVMVDDNEVAQPAVWQARLKKRIGEASKITEAACRMRLEIDGYGAWTSDDSIDEFELSLREFVALAKPAPGQLAIGFTSLYARPKGPTKLGGIPGPFFPCLLIREWPKINSEAERLEVLVHELGHYLGASHSAEPSSSVRPNVGDKKANARTFHIGYDGLNTLAMNLVADELRQRPVQHLSFLPPQTKRDLAQIYLTLGRALPSDPAAWRFLGMLGASAPDDQPGAPKE